MSKILINQTASDINLDVGLTIPASSQITISPLDFDEASDSDDIVTLIGIGDIIVNNGSINLSKADGIRLIQGGFTNRVLIDDNLIQSNRIKINLDNTLTGPQGAPGIDANRIFDGIGIPAVGLGNDNDYYIDTSSGDFYEKNSGIWNSIGNIKGPQGGVGPQGIQGIQGIQGDIGNTGPQGIQGEIGPAGTTVFGSEYNYTESLTQSSTNSTSFQTKLTLNVSNLPSGNYRLNWTFNWSHSVTNTDFEARVRQDSLVELDQVIIEPKDSGTDQEHPASGFKGNLSLNGNHTFTIEWRTSYTDDTAWIRNARLELWRVS